MRVADKMTYDQILKNVTQNRSEMYDLQNKAATQKQVNKPSDDPVAAARVLSARIDLKGIDQYMKNLNYAQSFLEFTDQSLDDLSQNLVRLKELTIAQVNDASSNKGTRRAVATEVDQIYNQIVKIGNRKLADRFIFGGYKTTRVPFKINGEYHGDRGEMLIGLDKENYLPMNVPGSKVFLGEGLSADGISHASSTQPATIEEFLVENFNSNKASKPKAESSHPEVSQRGPASVEGSLRSSVNRSKVEGQEVNGVNLFSLVKKVEISLKTDDKISLQNTLEQIDDAISQVVLARSQVGARSMALNNSLETLQKGKVDGNGHISNLEDADAFQVVSDINKTESTLKATLATSGKMMQDSLMDFIR